MPDISSNRRLEDSSKSNSNFNQNVRLNINRGARQNLRVEVDSNSGSTILGGRNPNT